jgi:AraC-like DNA-binding protein
MVPDPEDPLCEYCIYLKLSDKGVNDKRRLSPMSAFRLTTVWYGRDRHGIHLLMKSLFKELSDKNTGYRTAVESIIKQIIISCVRNYPVQESGADAPGVKSGDNLYLTIEEAFLYEYGTITLTTLAGRLNLSTRQTQRLLKEHYGMSFQSKKTEAKMSAAALMLRSPDVSITRIADELGYSSVEHFSSAFKRYYNISAGEYRKSFIYCH